MRRLLALPLLLVLAGCGTGGSVSKAKTAAPFALGGLAPVSVGPNVITTPAPEGSVLVWYADSRCPPAVATITLPPSALRDCLSLQARLATARIVKRDGIAIGAASPCYAYTGVMRDNCLDVAARTLPGVSYGMSRRWVRGMRVGELWGGCAHGISGDPVFVSLHDPSNVNATTAWEQGNAWLWLTFDRIDVTDGPAVAEATSAALAACGTK